jgi:hypothetical protein
MRKRFMGFKVAIIPRPRRLCRLDVKAGGKRRGCMEVGTLYFTLLSCFADPGGFDVSKLGWERRRRSGDATGGGRGSCTVIHRCQTWDRVGTVAGAESSRC